MLFATYNRQCRQLLRPLALVTALASAAPAFAVVEPTPTPGGPPPHSDQMPTEMGTIPHPLGSQRQPRG